MKERRRKKNKRLTEKLSRRERIEETKKEGGREERES